MRSKNLVAQSTLFTTLALLSLTFAACQPAAPTSDSTAADEAAVRSLVESFGQQLKTVSLLADNVPLQVLQQYGPFVAPELLALWTTDPSIVPGRLTSSPWPERIEITSIVQQDASTYLVTCSVIEVTSVEEVNGGVAAQYPVTLTVMKIGESWLITQYEQTGGYQ